MSESTPLPVAILRQIATAGALDEISNMPNAVRSHIFWHGKRDEATGKLRASMLFCVYQTTRHGPQNGFRLCLIHRGFYIAAGTKAEGDPEDDIDRLKAFIPQGHMETVVLGAADGETSGEDSG